MAIGFAVGSQVSVRGLVWEVSDLVPLGTQTLLHLRCTTGDLAGLEWDVLHPAESVMPQSVELKPEQAGSLTRWRLYHQACVLDQMLEPADAPVAQPGRLRIESYQLVPLMRIMELPRPRLLLADGVGLGKTVEAGLIIAELISRRRAHRVLVVSPPGPLLRQWVLELRDRFGLRFTAITDAASLQELRQDRELGSSPFDARALCMTSLDFAKQDHVLEELERSAWDLAVIDEAHHCVASAGERGHVTQRRRLAEVLARRSDGLLLLTATPHDGYDPHFGSLLQLLDPRLVDGQGCVVGTAYRRHVVRRLKSHIRDPATGGPLFHHRRVIPIQVAIAHEAVRGFHAALATLVGPRLRRAEGRGGHSDALAFIGLLKRSMSTIGACTATLKVVAERYTSTPLTEARQGRARTLRTYRRRLARYGVLDLPAEHEAAELEADSMAADLQTFAADELAALTRTDRTQEALQALIRLSELAQPFDPKVDALIRQVRAIRAERPGANIIVYTEYADSQAVAIGSLRAADAGEVLGISGMDSKAERARVADMFAQSDNTILVTTDSMAEGLNLQQRCCDLIHLDLPYNPNRLEQRNGRIDRYGQMHEPEIRYLYLAGTFEEQLLLRLIAKYESARARLDFMPPTLGVTADAADHKLGLVAGFAERQIGLFDSTASRIRTLDREAEDADNTSYRMLTREIERAFAGFERTAVQHAWWTGDAASASCRPRAEWPIDLPEFVASAAGGSLNETAMLLPHGFAAGLGEFAGYDPVAATFHFTCDPDRFADVTGKPLGFLGRAHPLVQRAISWAQRDAAGPPDHRVGVARANIGVPPAVLLSYAIELRSQARCELRRILAVRLSLQGRPVVLAAPEQWLQPGAADRQTTIDGAWQRWFADWVPRRRPSADAVARVAMQRHVADFLCRHDARWRQDAVELENWAAHRAAELCGAPEPQSDDLFGAVSTVPAWRSLPTAIERLAAYAVDPRNSPARRREADTVVALHQQRMRDRVQRATLAAPTLRAIGMLLLVPQESAS